MAQKLIKVAKEFNVGLHTIVETLHSKGFPLVEEKPTADISDEMLTVLQKEFQKDLAIKQEADKLARPVLKKDPIPPPASTPPTPTAAPNTAPRTSFLPPREEGPKVVLPKVEEPREVKPAVQKEEPEVVQRERHGGLRVVGRIDLDAQNRPQAPKQEEKKPAPPPPPPPPPAEPAAPPAPVVEKPSVAPAPERKPAAEAPVATPPAKEPAAPVQTPAPVEKPAGTTPETIQESTEPYRADAPQLRGLKILGRISLDKPKPEPTPGDRNRNQQGGNRNQPGGNRGGAPGSGNRNPQQGGQNRPANATGGTSDAGSNDPNRHKRKRKKVQTPVTAASLQASMSGGTAGAGGGGERRGPLSSPPTARRDDQPKEVSQKQIEDQIRQTMARMGASASRKRQKIRRDKRDERRERAELLEQERSEGEKVLQVTEFISVSDLASLMNIKPADVIKACMSLGIFVSINQRLDAELIEVVASEFHYEVQFISAEEQVEVEEEELDDPKDLVARQPIVTVMGHVDHGKTSLLDFIRSANVAEGEAGGITQHIGAYEVKMADGQEITFLDTPGHEAFTAMRARGAKVTDIAIIVIAADDSIMPQTREAISHAQAAGVPLVFAINKIDKPGADPERIKNELAQMNLLVESWGGKYQSQDISAKKGENVDKLLEKVLLEAELLELKANPARRAIGTVLEASLDKGRGYVTKMLVENGTLHDGDPIIAGEFSGKVKAMFNERGKKIKEAGPATPVLVLGLPGAPQAGEKIKVARSDSEAKEIATKRAQIIREQSNRASKRISLEEIGRRLALGNFKELNLIVKGDVDGSIEALTDSLIKLSMEKIQVNVIHKAVGQIVDSDVMLASASDAIIIGFQVRPSLTARKLAEKEGVEIKMYSIIYEAIEEIKAAMEGMLEPTKEEEIMGQVEVREVYKISKVGTVAGCYVQEGKISRNHFIRIVRDGIVVYPGNANQNAEIASLKRFKEDAKEVKSGMECGITIKNFNDIKVGDIIESYVINEVKTMLR
ncbi:MAG TPA: translation initiation factor IF-2 [Saprospiraceae bacterium]|nr:translation initiation factor IF-2 [Saprospiraceae bacterium]